MYPEDLRYHPEHAWVRVEGNRATVGISHYAQDSLGDIVYLDLPEVGAAVKQGKAMAEVESVKTTSPIISPVTGTVVRVNEGLNDAPETVNQDPYGEGWIAVVELEDAGELEHLLTADAYRRQVSGEGA